METSERDTLETKAFSFPYASEQKTHSVWPVWNLTALLITARREKTRFIKSVFQKQSNRVRVAFPFQESGLCKYGLKSVLTVTEKRIAIAMTRTMCTKCTKCTKRTRNRYSLFHFMKNTQGCIAGLSWRGSGVIISGIGKHPASLWKPLFVMRASFILTSELKSLRKYWKSFSVKKSGEDFRVSDCWNPYQNETFKKAAR